MCHTQLFPQVLEWKLHSNWNSLLILCCPYFHACPQSKLNSGELPGLKPRKWNETLKDQLKENTEKGRTQNISLYYMQFNFEKQMVWNLAALHNFQATCAEFTNQNMAFLTSELFHYGT